MALREARGPTMAISMESRALDKTPLAYNSGAESSRDSATSQSSQAKQQTNRVRTIKEVVTGIYREADGTVLTLKKIQRLGFEAEHIITQHFLEAYGISPSRVEVVHSRRHSKSHHTVGALRSPNIAYAVFSDKAAVDAIMGYASARTENIGGLEVSLQRFFKRDKRELSPTPVRSASPATTTPVDHVPYSYTGSSSVSFETPPATFSELMEDSMLREAAQQCPMVQAAAVDPTLAMAVMDWLQLHPDVLSDIHPSVDGFNF
ncbi:hypothetical protein FOZ63_018242 [Perkinsus olseni]|uniref:Uncharacterized protein n=1 Tax=Perkinsus olseni TaxID=32597 RepID=A0A7J6SK42_PEROL|nr:hypothetical protein FOZ62_021043 [Perkinsus olseni]KAF4733288.1 hypothetical protein FOZ63_018242 [Perkinsus olseni]